MNKKYLIILLIFTLGLFIFFCKNRIKENFTYGQDGDAITVQDLVNQKSGMVSANSDTVGDPSLVDFIQEEIPPIFDESIINIEEETDICKTKLKQSEIDFILNQPDIKPCSKRRIKKMLEKKKFLSICDVNVINRECEEKQEEMIFEEREMIEKKKNFPIMWDGKLMKISDIIKKLLIDMENCGIQDLKIPRNFIKKLNSTKMFLNYLPLLKANIREKITYDQIKCFVTKFDSTNYINIINEKSEFPSKLPVTNMNIINNYLYQFTPYGVIRYELPNNLNEKFNITYDNNFLNACMEATFINDINFYNNDSFPVIAINGDVYKIKNNKFFNLKTGKETTFSYISTSIKFPSNTTTSESVDRYQNLYLGLENPTTQKKTYYPLKDEDISKDINLVYDQTKIMTSIDDSLTLNSNNDTQRSLESQKILSLVKFDNVIHIIRPQIIKPANTVFGKAMTDMIQKNNLVIKGVIPFYYYNNKFVSSYLFLCNDNFYFQYVNDRTSELFDFEKDFKCSFVKRVDYKMSQVEVKVLLEQLVKNNQITNIKKDIILNSLNCQ